MTRAVLPVAARAQVGRALAELVRPRRTAAACALVSLVVGAAVGLVAAPLLGRIVDLVVQHAPAGAIYRTAAWLAVIAIVDGLATMLGIRLIARVGEGMLAQLRERFVAHALDLPLERIEAAGAGDLTSRVTADVALVGEAVREAVPEFARAMLIIVLTLGGLALLDWRFLLAALLAVPVQVLTARWYLHRSGSLYAEQRAVGGAQQQQLLDTLSGVPTVRAFGLAEDQTARVRERADDVVTLAMRVVRLQTRFFGRLNMAEFVGAAAVLVVGFVLVRDGTVTIGTAGAAALYFVNLFTPVNQVLFLLDTAQSATASLARILGIADHTDTGDSHSAEHSARPVDAGIRTKDLRYSYVPGHDVLDGVDLDVPAGTRVALVGASGAGKTTLAALLAGIHPPDAGTIEIGGVPLAEMDPALVRRTVVLVTQEVHVFAGTLADDLRLARPDASDAELVAALDAVGALSWARALPDGLDTVVGTGGHGLTVVAAQQLALARLILADPPVAILDEATAEAGSAGAGVLEAAAERALANRTGLTVAHRLTQARGADLVVVLDAGRIVEQGTHEALLAADGPYAHLWSAWSDQR